MPKKATALKRTWRPEKKAQEGRKHDNSKVYNSRRWRKHRKVYLTIYPLCVECEKEGKITIADVLDHIKTIANGGDIWGYDNVQGVCHSHHNKKSGREAHAPKGVGGANL
jgi:5-methylcytosine-specific restriction protein A